MTGKCTHARTHARTHRLTPTHTTTHLTCIPLCVVRVTQTTRACAKQTSERSRTLAPSPRTCAPYVCRHRSSSRSSLESARGTHTRTLARTHACTHAARARARTHPHTAARSHDVSRDEVCVGTTLVSQALSAGRASPTRAASRSIHLLAQICFSQFG